MPHLISRQQALAELSTAPPGCFLCALNAGNPPLLLARENGVAVFLSRYPRFWGQILVTSLVHCESFTTLDPATWLAMNQAAQKAARLLEQKFAPARCYVASLGATRPLPMTTPHLHLNIVPVPEPDLKPSDVFTWQHGLYDGTAAEWAALRDQLREEWREQ